LSDNFTDIDTVTWTAGVDTTIYFTNTISNTSTFTMPVFSDSISFTGDFAADSTITLWSNSPIELTPDNAALTLTNSGLIGTTYRYFRVYIKLPSSGFIIKVYELSGKFWEE
jgi:hypothetical protein